MSMIVIRVRVVDVAHAAIVCVVGVAVLMLVLVLIITQLVRRRVSAVGESPCCARSVRRCSVWRQLVQLVGVHVWCRVVVVVFSSFSLRFIAFHHFPVIDVIQ